MTRNVKKYRKHSLLNLNGRASAKKHKQFYLMKLGKPPRGIIAHGIITQEKFEDGHWDYDKADKNINYIEGKCDTLLNYSTQKILDVSVLDERCPQQYWHPQS